MIKAFPKPPEKPKDEKRNSSVGKICDGICDNMLHEAALKKEAANSVEEVKTAAWWTDKELADRKKAPAGPVAPAGRGAVQPTATRPGVPVPPKNQMQPDAKGRMQQQIEMKKWRQQHMKALAEAMTSLQKTVNVVMNSPMTKSDKTLVSFLNNYGALLNPQNILKNPQAIGELQAATNELAQEFGAFSARWSGAAQKGQAFLAKAVQEITTFNQMLGMIAGGPQKPAPAGAAAPQSEFNNPAWNG